MADRYRQQRGERYSQDRYNQDRYSPRSGQQEQFYSERGSQYGETGGSFAGDYRGQDLEDDSDNYSSRTRSGYGAGSDRGNRGWQDRGQSYSRGYDPLSEYDRKPSYGSRQARGYDYNAPREAHSSFRADDYGSGVVYGDPMFGAYSSGSAGYAQLPGYAGLERDRSGRGAHERGFLERAGDEIASWFGDEEAERRRERDHRGRGPTNYTRSDERILEDACDRLTDDSYVDASDITVSVDNGEVTLSGTVPNRQQKRRAEDCVESISGIGHVQNNLRVAQSQTQSDTTAGTFG